MRFIQTRQQSSQPWASPSEDIPLLVPEKRQGLGAWLYIDRLGHGRPVWRCVRSRSGWLAVFVKLRQIFWRNMAGRCGGGREARLPKRTGENSGVAVPRKKESDAWPARQPYFIPGQTTSHRDYLSSIHIFEHYPFRSLPDASNQRTLPSGASSRFLSCLKSQIRAVESGYCPAATPRTCPNCSERCILATVLDAATIP
jgi:hypothetical protein